MPLLVVSVVSPAGPEDVYLDGEIRVTFNQPLDSNTVSSSTILVYRVPAYQRWSVETSLENGNTVLVIRPTVPYEPNRSYQLLIIGGNNGVRSTTGETLESNYGYSFKTKNKLKPEQTQPASQVQEQFDSISSLLTPGTTVVVADTDLQGELEPYRPCPPTGFGTDEGAQGPGQSNRLRLIHSEPENYTNGVLDVSTIQLWWEEDIKHNVPMVGILSYQELRPGANPFDVFTVPHSSNSIATGEISNLFFQSVNTLNREFVLTVPAGQVSNLNDTKTNATEKIYFTGRLEPMFCTFEIAKASAGLWMVEFTKKDIYYYNKLIYWESVHAMIRAGYSNPSDIPPEVLAQLSRYVCCLIALYMMVYRGEESSSGGIGVGNLYVRRRELPGMSIEYAALGKEAGDSSPAKEALKRLMDCIKQNSPEDDTDLGVHVIRHGIKSERDPSFPIRRML